jgi:hypothetical protein
MAKRSVVGKMVILEGSRVYFWISRGSVGLDLQFGAIGWVKLEILRAKGLSGIIFLKTRGLFGIS